MQTEMLCPTQPSRNLRKTIFYTPRPSTRGGLKNINTPDAEMLSPTQPTLETYITKGANLSYDNGVTGDSLLPVLHPLPLPP